MFPRLGHRRILHLVAQQGDLLHGKRIAEGELLLGMHVLLQLMNALEGSLRSSSASNMAAPIALIQAYNSGTMN